MRVADKGFLVKYRSLLSNRNFMLITAGETVSQFGSQLSYIARMALVLKMTGRALDLGTVTILSTLPSIVFGPLAGWLADRLPRRTIAVVSNLSLAIITLLFTRAHNLWAVYGLAFAAAVVSSFFLPAKQAMVPSLVGRDELVEMNAFNVSIQNIVQIAAPAAGGLIVAGLGFSGAFFIDAATFLFAATMTYLVQYRQKVGKPAPDGQRPRFRQELEEGVRFIWNNVSLRYVFAFDFFLTLIMSMQGVLTFLYVQTYLGGPVAKRVGLLYSVLGIGAVLGSLVTGWLLHRMGKIPLLLAALAFDGTVVMLFSQTSTFPLAMFWFTLLGVILTVSGVTSGTVVQQETPEEMRGRVYGIRGPLFNPVQLLSIGGGSALAAWVGARWVFFGSGLGEVVLALGGRLSRAYEKVKGK